MPHRLGDSQWQSPPFVDQTLGGLSAETMMDGPSPLDHGLADGMERLRDLARILDDDAEFEPSSTGRRLRAVSRADGLTFEIELRSDTLWVDLAGWRHGWQLEDEDAVTEALAEASDLVAAIVTGRLLVEERAHRGRTFERRVLWAEGDEARVVGTVRLSSKPWWSAWWGGVERRRLRHLGTLPPGLRVGRAGTHPTAPWLGLLEDATAVEPIEIPLDGELDLHTFAPKQVGKVVEAYLDACRQGGLTELRIVHGKGIGNLRRTVHAILDRHPAVASYRLGGHGEGSWGATLVTLGQHDKSPE